MGSITLQRRGTAVAAAAVLAVSLAATLAVVLLSGDDAPEDPAPRHVVELLSRPDLLPPELVIDEVPDRPSGRLVFLSPRLNNARRDGATHQQGAMALDERGRTVWWRPAPKGQPITDVRVQRFAGRPVLTWWQGATSKEGKGEGIGVIADERYRVLATVRAANGHTADLHEFQLTPRGTALLTIFTRVRRDLRRLGGRRDAQVTQGVVQEVDVRTGELLFEWESIDHVRPSESHKELPEDPNGSYDYFHINSVEEGPDGDLLVSARHTDAVYKIDKATGEVEWRLGGRRSDWRMARGTRFGWQHDARWIGPNVVQLLDNAAQARKGRPQRPSSVKRIWLDRRTGTARLVRRFVQPQGLWAGSQGNAQALRSGGVLAGWGSTGAFTRFGPRGRVVLDGHLQVTYDSYRAWTSRWVGRPDRAPALHVERDGDELDVAASWNGSTQVRRWQLLAGDTRTGLRPVGDPAEWDALETTFTRETDAEFVAVAALGRDGRELARSRTLRP